MLSHTMRSKDHAVVLDLDSCEIRCVECEVELPDAAGDEEVAGKAVFDFRRRFFKRPGTFEDFVSRARPLNLALLGSVRFPSNRLQTALLVIFADRFLRKSLKQVYLNENFANKFLCQKTAPTLLKKLGKLLFNLGRSYSGQKLLKRFYLKLISKEPRLSSYAQWDFGEYLHLFLEALHREASSLASCPTGP